MEKIVELLTKINWSDNVWKGIAIAACIAIVIAVYHLAKYLGSGLINSIKKLTEVSEKMDQRMMMMEQEQKAANERFIQEKEVQEERFEFTKERLLKHDDHIDMLMQSLINATKR